MSQGTRPRAISAKKKQVLISCLQRGMTIRGACEEASVTRQTYYDWRGKDRKFSAAVDRAMTASLFGPKDGKRLAPMIRAERTSRAIVETLNADLTVPRLHDPELIRTQALELFTKQLDGKLKNLQDGEMLQVTFRVDIVQANGKVRGGSGSERNMPEYIAWRKAVFSRDNFTCQRCGVHGGKLEAHHIQSWASHPEGRFDIENGMTLCADCHAQEHPHLRMMRHG